MEKIELRVMDHDGVPIDRHWHAVFGMAGGTIGRSGQNKLIISGSDTSVARVHAMVRLDTEGAFVANLSERNPIWVDDQRVGSGQEVPLVLGARIRIGAYTLGAVEPGTPFTAPPPLAEAPAAPMARQPLAQPEAAPPHQPAGLPTPASTDPTALAALAALATSAASAPAATHAPATDEAGALNICANPWEDLTQPMARTAPAARAGVALEPGADHQAARPQPKPQHRPLIPNDFDPFAPTPEQARHKPDSWIEGLPEQAGGDLIAQRHDGMVHELPLQGLDNDALDNASHTGLPPCFESTQKLDPLALFDRSGLTTDTDAVLHASARGSELEQAFSLPRIQATGAPPGATGIPAPAPAAVADAAPHQTPQQEAAAQAALHGLLPTDGLDLAIFESAGPAAAPLDAIGAGAAMPASNVLWDAGTPQAGATGPVGAGAPAQPMPQTARAEPGPDLASLAQAFIEGAGLDPSKTRLQVTPEFMRTFGEAMRIAVQGTIDLLAARSEIKREFRAGVTIIASGANNPLKFLPSADGVIMQMIHQTFPGFMKPLPAMQEAYLDLHVHQLALMAGIRAAYAEALTRFDPSELERRTENNPGLLDKILTNGRKAALWDDYKHNFDVLRRHAEDDLTAFSGRTFVDAYEQAEQSAKDPS